MMPRIVVLLFVGCAISTGNAHKLPNDGGILTAKGGYISGSISRTWRILSHGLSKSTDDNNQELLDEYSQYFDKLDSCIKKHDKKGVEETYSEILYLKQGTNPLIYSKEFPVENIDCMNLLLQDIISTNKINLQYLEACIKSFFNQCNAALQ